VGDIWRLTECLLFGGRSDNIGTLRWYLRDSPPCEQLALSTDDHTEEDRDNCRTASGRNTRVAVPNFRSRHKPGSRRVWRRVARGFSLENWIIVKKSRFVSEFKQNYRENVLVEFLFLLFITTKARTITSQQSACANYTATCFDSFPSPTVYSQRLVKLHKFFKLQLLVIQFITLSCSISNWCQLSDCSYWIHTFITFSKCYNIVVSTMKWNKIFSVLQSVVQSEYVCGCTYSALVAVTAVLVRPGVQITQRDSCDIECASIGCNEQQQKMHGTCTALK